MLASRKPLAAPRQGLTFSPVIIVAALLTVLIGVFAVYIGVQLVRFAKPPTLAVTAPGTRRSSRSRRTRRRSRCAARRSPEATVTHPGRRRASSPTASSADDDGPLDRRRPAPPRPQRVRHQRARPRDRKTSENTERVFITVPFLVLEAPTLTVDSPAEGAQFENGAIPVKGSTTNAPTVSSGVQTVTRRHADREPASRASPSATGGVGQPGANGRAEDGQGRLGRHVRHAARPVRPGKWQIVVTATSPEGKATTLTRDVSIRYKGVTLVVEVKPVRAWLKVWVDGKVSKVTGAAGKVYSPGKVLTFTAKRVDRGPHRQVERHVLHAQRRGPRADVEQGQPRDLAVRAAAASRPGPTAS